MAKTKLDYLTSQLNTATAKVFSAFNATTGHKHTGNTEDAPQNETGGIKDGSITEIKIGTELKNTINNPRRTFIITNGSINFNNYSVDGIYYNYVVGSNIYEIWDIKKLTIAVENLIVQEVYKMGEGTKYIRYGFSEGNSDITWEDSDNGNNGFWEISTNKTAQPKAVNATKTATSTGTQGQQAYDNDYFYQCVATNSCIRFAKIAWE